MKNLPTAIRTFGRSQGWLGARRRRGPRPNDAQKRLSIESLEGRSLLSVAPLDSPAAYADLVSSSADTAAADSSSLKTPDAKGGRLLIIANNGLIGSLPTDPLYVLKTHKESLGWTVDLVSTTTAGTTNTAIRDYIIGRYNNIATRPDALLLVGDADSSGSTGGIPAFSGKLNGGAATDLYYGCMTGTGSNWGTDWEPEIPVGRLSVNLNSGTGKTDLTNIVNKIVAYDTAAVDTWMSSAALIAGSGTTASVYEDAHNLALTSYLTPAGYTGTKLYKSSGKATADIAAAFNAGVGLAVYGGPGAVTAWDTSYWTSTNVAALTNTGKYPIVASFALTAGRFTDSSVCLAEAFLRAADKGAVAVLASSTASNALTTADNDASLENAFLSASLKDGYSELGMAVLKAKQAFHAGHSDDAAKSYYEQYNLFGDPTLLFRGLSFGIKSADPLPGVVVNQPYYDRLAASGGLEPYHWTVSDGQLPDGISLDAAAGVLTGTPTASGTSTFTLQLTDALSQTATRQYHLTVADTLAFTTPTVLMPYAVLGQSYSNTLAAAGGVSPYTMTLLDTDQYSESDLGDFRWFDGGTAQGWNGTTYDDTSHLLTFPSGFTFPFYGKSYSSVHVSSNGFLDFAAATSEPNDTVSALKSNVRIAGLWTDLQFDSAGEDTFITQNDKFVSVRWKGHVSDNKPAPYGGSPVEFEIVLYRTGRIRVNYSNEMSVPASTIGVSAGGGSTNTKYTISALNGLNVIPAYKSYEYLAYGCPGISLNTSNALVGTPTAIGSFPVKVQVQDSFDAQQTAVKIFTLNVVDPSTVLSVELPTNVWENQGTATGTVHLSQATAEDVTVWLASADATELTVPYSVKIPAGQTSYPFTITVIDDSDRDGIQTVKVTAVADGYAPAEGTVPVADNEPDHFVLDSIPLQQYIGVAFNVTSTTRGSACSTARSRSRRPTAAA
jgi:hypothetical protein